MRLGFLLLVLVATIFGSGYWYTYFDTTCKTPIRYHIGTIDSRFGTDKDELIRIAKNAEMLWEAPLGKDLFIYDENSSLPINLVFDVRQENAVRAEELREDLSQKEGMSESVGAQYELLIAEFRTLKKKYESQVGQYEEKLAAYNEEVTDWNKKGGAPNDVIQKLQDTQSELAEQQSELEAQAKKLNQLVEKLNAIGARGNSLITDYNTIVEEYNTQFSETEEFTQGDYTTKTINIYQFDSEEELTLVLAHEFGHALSIGHVQNAESIMYYFMGKQQSGKGLSAEDIAEFNKICSEKGVLERVITTVSNLF